MECGKENEGKAFQENEKFISSSYNLYAREEMVPCPQFEHSGGFAYHMQRMFK